jgi:uncharacterized protein (TIGR03067 family)
MKLLLPPLVLVGLLGAAGGPAADRAGEELKKLEGTWKVVAMEVSGKPVPAGKLPVEKFIIKGDQVVLRERGKDKKAGIRVDPTREPRALDLLLPHGKERVTWKGIYALKGDELKICMPVAVAKGTSLPPIDQLGARPDSFSTKGRARTLIVARREGRR